jgi:hypothetical protein
MALSGLFFDLGQHCTRLRLDEAHALHLSGLLWLKIGATKFELREEFSVSICTNLI